MENHLFSLKDRIAVVTGGGRGLGFVYAKALMQFGATVVICDVNEKQLSAAVEELKAFGEISGYSADVSSEQDVQQLVAEVIDRYGRVDILVNNAGVVQRTATHELSEAEWDRIMDVNLKGTFLCCKYFGEHMRKARSGKIINISSIAGVKAMELRLGYCTSKAGISHLTRTLAYEWGPDNIQVNAIGPGYIKSSMNEDIRNDPAQNEQYVSRIRLGHFGEPEDLIGVLILLAGSGSDYITGQTIYVDGGVITH